MRSSLGALGLVLAGCCIASTAQTAPPPASGAGPVYSSDAAAPSAALTLEQRADLFMARREYEAALDLMRDAARRHLATPALYNRMGIASEQLLDFKPAAKYYKKAISGDRKSANFVNNLGTVYYEQHNYKNAARQFTAAIKLDHAKAPYYVNLGGAEFSQKHFDAATTAYRAALRLDPNALFANDGVSPIVRDVSGTDTPRFHYDLARLMCSMGLMDDAVHQFRKAYEQHYADLKRSLTDPAFAPLRLRPEYQALMGTGADAKSGVGGVRP